MPIMSIGEYARHRGVDPKAIRIKIDRGFFSDGAVPCKEKGKIQIDQELADFEWEVQEQDPVFAAQRGAQEAIKVEKSKKLNGGVLPESKPPEVPKMKVVEKEVNGEKRDVKVFPTLAPEKHERYRDAKTTSEEQRARKLELEVAELEGRLLDKDEVKDRVLKLVGETRDALINIPGKIAPLLVSITDPIEMETKLLMEINQALEGLSRFDK